MYDIKRSAEFGLNELESDAEFQALCDFWNGQDQPFYSGLAVAWVYQKPKWISLVDELPSNDLLSMNDILIYLENGAIGIGSFALEGENIKRMTFNGTGKHIDYWKYKPTHWMHLPPNPPLQ